MSSKTTLLSYPINHQYVYKKNGLLLFNTSVMKKLENLKPEISSDLEYKITTLSNFSLYITINNKSNKKAFAIFIIPIEIDGSYYVTVELPTNQLSIYNELLGNQKSLFINELASSFDFIFPDETNKPINYTGTTYYNMSKEPQNIRYLGTIQKNNSFSPIPLKSSKLKMERKSRRGGKSKRKSRKARR